MKLKTLLQYLLLFATLTAPRLFAATNPIVSADIVSGTNYFYKTNTYLLDGFVYVETNEVLVIEAGTVVKFKPTIIVPGVSTNTSALFVSRGGKIYAQGTAQQPIIFTAEADDVNDPSDLPFPTRGLWGGLVLMGNAPINKASNAGGNAATPKYDVFEGLADIENHRYGGDVTNDNSGVMRYCSIRHGGKVIDSNKELNGLSFGGVGNGTTIEFIEAFCIADDGFEFFGGTVNTKYLISTFNDDDTFDTDQGYTGKNQFWFSIQLSDARDKGGELNGEPGNGNTATGLLPVSNFEVYNATFIGAGAGSGGSGNNTFTVREGSAPKFYNSVFTDFAQRGITIDQPSYTNFVAGLLDYRDNLWFGYTAGNTAANISQQASGTTGNHAEGLFTNAVYNNSISDPLLRGISRTNNAGLDPRPQAASPALISTRTAPNNGFYTPVGYKGAFGGSDYWMQGWSAMSVYGFVTPSTNVIEITDADIAGTVSFYRTNTYVLSGFVYVETNEVLNIEAGTVVKFKPTTIVPGVSTNTSALIVARGGKIYAEGTPTRPIIFTAEADDVNDPSDLPFPTRGLWGGVVLMGSAPINKASNAGGNAASPKYDIFEGLPDIANHRYGGNASDDSSGIMRYCSIRHGGKVIDSNKELNGLSFCGVGNGTTIEFIEAFCIADDGFEFFGGTVNTRYMVSAFNDDDTFDTDQGYTGKNQFWFSIQAADARDKGGELNGEPGNGNTATGLLPISNFEVFNATFIGAGVGSGGSGNNVFTVREASAPKFYNSIFTDFAQRGISIDNPSKTQLDTGLLDFRDNLWFNFGGGNGVGNIAVQASGTSDNYATVLFTETDRNNQILNPVITSINRTPAGSLDPRPQAGSPAYADVRSVPVGTGFYTQVGFKGAFGAGGLWIEGWTALSAEGFLPPKTNVVNINNADIVAGTNQFFRTNIYVLDGFVYVETNEVLVIEAGTVVKFRPTIITPGVSTNTAALIVARGGKIYAEGTPTTPIIFTAEADDVNNPNDLPFPTRGLWGGIVLMGNAPINKAGNAGGNAATPKYDIFEGLADIENHRYGGGDGDDSSGVMRYCSIRHGGKVIDSNKELNALSFCGVGRGTVIEFIEAFCIADDGFEFFGGTVNTRYMVSAFNDDDTFDTDQGYTGKNQFWFSIQNPDARDKGGELNGEPGNGNTATGLLPVSNFEVFNATFIGAGVGSGGSGNNTFTVREGSAPKFYNSIFTDFAQRGISIDNPSYTNFVAGLLDYRDNLWYGFGGGNTSANIAIQASGTSANYAETIFTETARNNFISDPLLRGISRTNNAGLDPRPQSASPALTSTRIAPVNAFYIPVGYKGAFGSYNWCADWTALSAYNFMSGLGGAEGEVVAETALLKPVVSGGNVEVKYPTAVGRIYQLQSSTNLTIWTDATPAAAGTGGTNSFSESASGVIKAYRVIVR